MKLIFALAAPLALSACVTVYPPDEPKGDSVAYARFGETVSVGPVRVTPLTLLEDSRCPQGVQCVWAGRVRVTARLNADTRELTSGQPIAVSGGSLTLIEVQPVRRAGVTIAPRDYRFGFRFAS